jgi:hypothetical protein
MRCGSDVQMGKIGSGNLMQPIGHIPRDAQGLGSLKTVDLVIPILIPHPKFPCKSILLPPAFVFGFSATCLCFSLQIERLE